MTLPPVAQAFHELAAECHATLKGHGPKGLHVVSWRDGRAKVKAMGEDHPTAGEPEPVSAHAKMAWAAQVRRIQDACATFRRASRKVPHLAPLAKRLEIQIARNSPASISFSWGNLDFGVGYPPEHALCMPTQRMVKAIAAVETSKDTVGTVLLHNRLHTRPIGRCDWPLHGARRFARIIDPHANGAVAAFAAQARFLRGEAKDHAPGHVPDAVRAAFDGVAEALRRAPHLVDSASLLWGNGGIAPYLWLKLATRHGTRELGPKEVAEHPLLAPTGWIDLCADATNALDQALKAWLPCAHQAMAQAPLVVGFGNSGDPHVQILGTMAFRPEDLAFPIYGGGVQHLYHTTQGGAQHLDVPATSPEAAAGFVRARRNLRQLVEVWKPL